MKSYEQLSGMIVAAGLLITVPAALSAQTCLGDANLPGQYTIGGYGSFTDGANAFGVESRSNFHGPIGMGARIGRITPEDSDENITSAGGHLAFEIPRGTLSLCPVGGVEYDFWSDTFGSVNVDLSRLAFPFGFSVGSRLGGMNGGAAVIPSAQVGLIHQRFSSSASIGDGPGFAGFEGNQTDPFLEGGATVHFGVIYARGGIYRILHDDAQTVFRLGVGLVF